MYEEGHFYIKCHNIFYNLQELKDIVSEIPEDKWIHGKSRNGLHWPVHEFYQVPNTKFIKDLKENLNLNFKNSNNQSEPYIFISRVGPGGLNPHYDNNRWCGLLFPISGNFEKTPQVFATDNLLEIERFYFSKSKIHNNLTPVLFNSRIPHAVIYPKEMEGYRHVLVVNIHEHPSTAFQKIKDGKLLTRNTTNLRVGQ